MTVEKFKLVRVRDRRTGAESLTRESWIDLEVHEVVTDVAATPSEPPSSDDVEHEDTPRPVDLPSRSALARMSVARLKELPAWGLVPGAVKARCTTKGDVVSALLEV